MRNQQNRLHIHSPGRINLIGEHTDYNGGYVLPAAIDKAISFSALKTSRPVIKARSLDFGQKIEFETAIQTLSGSGWARYFQAAALELKERGYTLPGLDLVFSSDLPAGAGMSSSAALVCGFLATLDEMAGWRLSKMEMARIAQATEHRTGVNCGIMDMFAVLHGKAGHAMLLDCRDLSFRYVPVKMSGCRLVLINSMVKHELASTAYNDRRRACENALKMIREDHPEITNLKDAEPVLEKYRNRLGADFQKISYIVEENRRVLATVAALEADDMQKVGELLYQSHWGLSKKYEVSCPELDLLVETAAATHGVLGARLMGGGFGGCTLSLIKDKLADAAVNTITKRFEAETGQLPGVYEIKISDGIRCTSRSLSASA